ncbi:ATP-binding protein [Candidatus Poriferisodalis sp.]|uniref:ATP-binding protein n=1 Tax=Candidatus Poriferisodalis sp. TaxID=3101277 RepID=UPI003B027C9A
MRDIGYSLGTALADLVDNCLTAGAHTIRIVADTSSAAPRIGILDDGVGMDEATLVDAMRLGTRSPLEERDRSDLGRFGLGLKTASFSQCRQLTVVTKQDGAAHSARWDLDYVAKTNEWLVQVPETTAGIPWAEELGDTGTLVLWETLTAGVLEGADESDLIRELDDARSHLELVFHRFLAGEPGLHKVKILMNERPLEPFDPFHSKHPATIVGSEERIRFEGEAVIVKAFTLPHHSKVSSVDWDLYAGREGYLKNQGFYVYREGRLILHGTWFGLTRQTELAKLARVRVDMPNSLDTAWKIDIKKASAQLPNPIRKRLARIIEPLGASSKRVYRTRGRRLAEATPIPLWNRLQNKGDVLYRLNVTHPMVDNLASQLEPEHHNDLMKLLEVVGSALPLDTIFSDLGETPDQHRNTSTSDDALHYAATTTLDYLTENGYSVADAMTVMQDTEPFKSSWKRTRQMLKAGTLQTEPVT